MAKYQASSDESSEILLLLQRDPPLGLCDSPGVIAWVQKTANVDESWIAERLAWHALKAVTTSPETGERRPLLAARILLNFYRYPSDPSKSFGICDQPLNKYVPRQGTTDGRPQLNKTERQTIAAAEGGYGSRSQLSGTSHRLVDVAESVWLAMQAYVLELEWNALQEIIFWLKVDGPLAATSEGRRGDHVFLPSEAISASPPDVAPRSPAESELGEQSRVNYLLISNFPESATWAIGEIDKIDLQESRADSGPRPPRMWWLMYLPELVFTTVDPTNIQLYLNQKLRRIRFNQKLIAPKIYEHELQRVKSLKKVALIKHAQSLPRKERFTSWLMVLGAIALLAWFRQLADLLEAVLMALNLGAK